MGLMSMVLPALSPTSPLASVLADIQKAIEARLYYPALLTALTVPDICAALALDNSIFVKEKHYVDFVDKYAAPRQLGLTGLECYRLRGGVVHRANMVGNPKFNSTHVVFSLPETNPKIHGLSIESGPNKGAMLDLLSFCNAMDAAAKAWYEDHQNDAKVASNMKNLLRYIHRAKIPIIGEIGPIVASGP
jgi:hypothetical protein